jgi:hypothetical protein
VKRLRLYHDYGAEVAELAGTPPTKSHVDEDKTIHSGTILVAPDGSIPAIFVSQKIGPKLLKRAYRDWRKVNGLPTQRSNAAGAPLLQEIKKDETLSEFHSVPGPVLELLKKRGVRTGRLGYLGGHRTPLSKKHPEMLHRHKSLVRLVNSLYRRYAPTYYKMQRAAVKKIRHIPGTAFTTTYPAKNWETCYHTDGNLPGGRTCLIVMGKFSGGELVLPRWRIAFALQPGDILFFDAEQLHGNLPFKGERLSAAFYCARHIAKAAVSGKMRSRSEL